MPGIRHDKLVEHYVREPAAAAAVFREALAAGHVKPSEVDLGKLFVACFGWSDFAACRENRQSFTDTVTARMSEAQGAVSTAAFQNISGQIVYSAVLEKYQAEEFVFSRLIPEEPVTNGTLDGEKIGGLSEIGDVVQVRKEGDPYALAGIGENWVFAPAVKDRGVIVPVTWEAVFADRTGKLLEYAGDVGTWAGVNKEKRAIDCVVDENTTAHRYNWRGTVIATYGDNSGSHTWDNLAASNPLTDWTSLNAAEQAFNGLVDPFTGEPINVEPRHVIATKQLEQTLMRTLSATEIRVATPGFAASGTPTVSRMNNPYLNKYTPVTSRRLAARLATDTDWFLGDLTKYARYRVAEPLAVVQAPSNNQDEFHRRIVQQYRVNERGAYYVREPRAMLKNTA